MKLYVEQFSKQTIKLKNEIVHIWADLNEWWVYALIPTLAAWMSMYGFQLNH